MNLPKFAVKHPVTVAMLMTAICLLGVISFDRLGTDLLPSIYNPRIVVELRAGERSPQEIEQRFARSLEGELSTISRVVDVNTICRTGRALTTVTFSWGTDMDFALLDVQKKVSSYESDPEVERVTVARFDPNQEPIMSFALRSSGERDLDELRRIAENMIKRNLERLAGVARVETRGGLRRELSVELDEYRLQAYRLSPSEITAKIREANVDAAGGQIVENNTAYLIKGIGKYSTLDEVAKTVVGFKTESAGNGIDTSAAGRRQAGSAFGEEKVPIFLDEVARIRLLPAERSELVRLDGNECVGLFIYKEAGENTVKVADAIESVIADMSAGLPDLEFTLIHSQASFIDQAIGEVENTAIIGIILAVMVLFVFLRHFGATMIVSLAIPISILATFMLMYFQSLSLNVMTLGGLALGAGMLVDNAIVVIENIFRRRQLGEEAGIAAAEGTTEVGVAILASTLTTVIVFLPIVYVRGIAAELFREQAWVVAFSLLSSLLVAFLLIPSLAARTFRKESEAILKQRLNLPFYDRLLVWSLNHPVRVIAVAVMMLAVSVLLLPVVGTDFVPRTGENQLQIVLKLPAGSHLDRTGAVLSQAEHRIRSVLGEQVRSLFSTVNVKSTQDLFEAGDADAEHRGEIVVTLAGSGAHREPAALIAVLRTALDFPETETAFRVRETTLQQTIGTDAAPIVIEVRGDDMETLREINRAIVEAVGGVNGLHTVESSFQAGRPEITLTVDHLMAASLGLDIRQIAALIKERIAGEVASEFYSEGEDRQIRVAYPVATLAELKNLPVQTSSGAVLRLDRLCRFEFDESPKEIQRRNQSRISFVTAQLDQNTRLSEAVAAIERLLPQIAVPPNYEVDLAGTEAWRQSSFDELEFALLLSIVLVYMVLASLFESFLHPFTILLTLPLAGVGVVVAFLLVGEPLSVMALIGVVMLAGIAVNDSIVLVDYINRLRAKGREVHDAIVTAARDRLRPILMTSATTILALLPLTIGFGEGARLRAPMAIAVIGGLVSSTFLTLVVIPVVYGAIESLRKYRTGS